MADFQPVYRGYVFATNGLARNANGTLNLAGSTLLTPIAGADHSDPFKVATAAGITGFQPYMGIPQGRRGRVDFLSKRTDIGALTVPILDKKLGSGNFQRWVTAFVGDEAGRRQLMGKEFYVEESTDGGSSYDPFFLGRIQRPSIDDRLWFNMEVRDLSAELEVQTFRGIPIPSYAHPTSLLPIGNPFGYGPHQQTPFVPGSLGVSNTSIAVDNDLRQLNSPDRSLTTVVRALRAISAISRPYYNTDQSAPDERVHGARLLVRLVGGPRAGEEGYMWIVPFTTLGGPASQQLTGHMVVDSSRYLASVGVEAIDPAFDPSTWDTTDCEFCIVADGDASKTTPIFIDDVHPVQLWADLLDGKFGPLDTSGSVRFTTPRDVTAFDALIADQSFLSFRGFVTETAFVSEWVEKAILKPYNLSFYRDGEGRVVPVDLRSRDATGAPTITTDDLISASPPRAATDLSTAITDVRIKHYIETPIPREEVERIEGTFPDVAPYLLDEQEALYEVIDVGSPDVPPQSPYEIDGIGFRYTPGEETQIAAWHGVPIQGLTRRKYMHGKFDELVVALRTPYGSGAEVIDLTCRRTATTTALAQGNIALVDVDEIADPATNRRGGPRLGRVLEKTEDGIAIGLQLLDLGVNVTAGTPTLGALTLVTGSETQAITIPISALNVDGDPVRLDIAVTDTVTATRPAEGSTFWTMARYATATGNWTVTQVPANSRIWVRGRSEPSGSAGGGRLPSAWVFPSNASIDTQGLTAPSTLAIDVQGGAYLEASFTPGETDMPTEVWLDGFRRLRLPPGSAYFKLEGLTPSTTYNSPGLRVRHIDPTTQGVSAYSNTVTFTTSATAEASATYNSAVLLVGESG